MTIFRITASVVLACTVANSGLSETRPNFSGHWVLNKAKSKEYSPSMFKRRTMEVSQKDPALDIDIRDEESGGREFRAYLNLKTNGEAAVAMLGSPQRAVIRWEDSKLVIRWNLDDTVANSSGSSGRQGATPPFTWTWTLSPSGKALVNQIHVYGETGDILERLVYDKAP
jgi:hypothetical protein